MEHVIKSEIPAGIERIEQNVNSKHVCTNVCPCLAVYTKSEIVTPLEDIRYSYLLKVLLSINLICA